jgi:hypothetical protein
MPRPPSNSDEPRNGPERMQPSSPPLGDGEQLPDPLLEAEALRSLLHDAQLRLGRLLTALKQQRRQTRALRSVMDSLRNLRLDR